MVEFCTNCGAALPKGDVTIRGGELFTSHDYTCPNCHTIANPEKPGAQADEVEPDTAHDIVISQGSQQKE